MKRKLKEGSFSKVMTTSDDSFAFFIMRDNDKITTKEDWKQVKLAGKNLENVMIFLME